MKRFSLFAICMILVSCSTPSNAILNYRIVRREFHLGEYLQVENSKSLITVNRSAELSGLVRIDLTSNEVTILDPTAKEAREISLSGTKIIYRVGSEIRLWDTRPVSILTNAQKLRSFFWNKDVGRLTYETDKGESRWVSFRVDGKIISDGPLPGSGRTSFLVGSRETLIFEGPSGLFLGHFGTEAEGLTDQILIEKDLSGDYVKARILGDQLYIAYFDSRAGVIKLAKSSSTESFTIETIDGDPGKTYVGMDIAIFDDHGNPGLVYLDAWALKLRWARFKEGHWKAEQLPVSGAVGFYNQVLEESGGSVTIALHNFRSLLEDYEQIFENLAILKLNL